MIKTELGVRWRQEACVQLLWVQVARPEEFWLRTLRELIHSDQCYPAGSLVRRGGPQTLLLLAFPPSHQHLQWDHKKTQVIGSPLSGISMEVSTFLFLFSTTSSLIPDLALCNLWLFSRAKRTMRSKHFVWIQNFKSDMMVQLKTLRKEDFQNCFRKWQEQWDKCIWNKEDYFERD